MKLRTLGLLATFLLTSNCTTTENCNTPESKEVIREIYKEQILKDLENLPGKIDPPSNELSSFETYRIQAYPIYIFH